MALVLAVAGCADAGVARVAFAMSGVMGAVVRVGLTGLGRWFMHCATCRSRR